MAQALASVLKVPDPPLYVQYTPSLFIRWHKWAIRFEEPSEGGKIKPLGVRIGPGWMRWTEDFKGLEDFHQYYKEIKDELDA